VWHVSHIAYEAYIKLSNSEHIKYSVYNQIQRARVYVPYFY